MSGECSAHSDAERVAHRAAGADVLARLRELVPPVGSETTCESASDDADAAAPRWAMPQYTLSALPA